MSFSGGGNDLFMTTLFLPKILFNFLFYFALFGWYVVHEKKVCRHFEFCAQEGSGNIYNFWKESLTVISSRNSWNGDHSQVESAYFGIGREEKGNGALHKSGVEPVDVFPSLRKVFMWTRMFQQSKKSGLAPHLEELTIKGQQRQNDNWIFIKNNYGHGQLVYKTRGYLCNISLFSGFWNNLLNRSQSVNEWMSGQD